LYSVKNGSINWTYTINAPAGANSMAYIDNTPAIGSDGTIYFGVSLTDNATFASSYMYAINSNGTLKWKNTIPNISNINYCVMNTSPAINLQGNVIISTNVASFNLPSFTSYYSNLYSFI